MIFQDFIQTNNGRGLDFDGYYGDQCVDLAQFYNRDVLGNGERFGGNAVDIFGQQPDKFDWVINTPSGVPQPGDIMIWDGALNGGPGHIAIFIEGDTNRFSSFDQNWPAGSPCHVQQHNYNFVKGWGHFKTPAVEQGEPMEDLATAQKIAFAMAGRDPSDPNNIADLQANHVGKNTNDDIAVWWDSQEHRDYVTSQANHLAELTKQVADLQSQLAKPAPAPAPVPAPVIDPTTFSFQALLAAIINKILGKGGNSV